jgi:acetyltransferase-like isoleucine patch superfamily enzyme
MIHKSVTFGQYCVVNGKKAEDITEQEIEAADIHIGEGTVIMSFVEIRKGTVIGKDCYIDSGVKFSGDCHIHDRVTLRYDTIIARGCIIGEDTYFAPKCMTNNLDAGQKKIGGASVGRNCFIGTGSILQHGIFIAHDTKIGSNSFVNKSITQPYMKYIGTPAQMLQKLDD